MVKEKKKLDLFEVLKFTPRTYTVRMYGYGGEVVMGSVDPKVYKYFQDNDISIEDYATSWSDEESGVPEELQPFSPGSWYECDNIVHENGVEMNDACMIEVDDENGETVWSCSLDPGDLEDHGVTVEAGEEYYVSQLPPGTVVFFGQSFEKGGFFEGRLPLEQPFDPKKFTLSYVDVEGWPVNTGLMYNGEELCSDDYSTTGKSMHFEFLTSGDVPVHETGTDNPVDFPQSACDSEFNDEIPAMPELPTTDWFPSKIKPVRVGSYQCQLNKIATWPWPNEAMLIWTGRSWKDEDGKTIKPHAWRGLTEEIVL